jgi:hypothetical protein
MPKRKQKKNKETEQRKIVKSSLKRLASGLSLGGLSVSEKSFF